MHNSGLTLSSIIVHTLPAPPHHPLTATPPHALPLIVAEGVLIALALARARAPVLLLFLGASARAPALGERARSRAGQPGRARDDAHLSAHRARAESVDKVGGEETVLALLDAVEPALEEMEKGDG